MLRILLVNDDPDDRLLITQQLQQEFFQLEITSIIDAESFKEVLELGNFDVVISDYQLSWTDGLTILNAIKAKYPDCPVIMFTSTGSEEVAVLGMKSGLSDYVLKGKLQRLSLAVRQSIEQQRIRQDSINNIEQLQLSEEHLRLALEAANMGTWDWNVLTGEVVWSENHERLFGLLSGSFQGTQEAFLACVHSEDRESITQAIRHALATKTEYDQEYRVVWPNGNVRWIVAKGRFYANQQGEVTHMRGVVLDISERKWREQELEQANRLKDEFLAVISYELRTPLNAILGWARLLRSRNFDELTKNRSLEIIERNAIQQNHLINDIIDTNILMRGQMRLEASPVNLVTVIENVLNTVRLSADAKSISLGAVFDSSVVMVMGEENHLQQIFWNLIAIAIKFTPNGGRVKVQTDSSVEAQITVSHTGIGINPDFLSDIFDLFRQGNRIDSGSRSGLGLGLAIVKQLVELHSGRISADSNVYGYGTTFTVTLPLLIEEKQNLGARSNTDLKSLPLQGLQILAVDDDADNLELMAVIMEGEGANVTAVSSAEVALKILPELKPNILISDIAMHPINGYEFIRQVRLNEIGQSKKLPAIALTAYARVEDKTQAIALGFQVYLSKPVDPADLVRAVCELAKGT